MTGLAWHVLYTKPRCENQVERALAADGIEVYFPTLPAVRPRRGRPAMRPFFPCYLFVNLDLEAVGISRLNWTPGVRHLVMFGGVPARVDDGVIARIRQQLDQPHAMDRQGEILERGDRVVITAGPLEDIEAVFDKRLSATGRVLVLVQFLQRWTTVQVESVALRKISPYTKSTGALAVH